MARTGFDSSTATGPASSGGRSGNPGTNDGTRTACTDRDRLGWTARRRVTRSWQVPTLRKRPGGGQDRGGGGNRNRGGVGGGGGGRGTPVCRGAPRGFFPPALLAPPPPRGGQGGGGRG